MLGLAVRLTRAPGPTVQPNATNSSASVPGASTRMLMHRLGSSFVFPPPLVFRF